MKKLIAISLSLILALVLVCAASAETVQAKPVGIDPSNLEGRMVRTDIEYKEGDKMQLTLYVPERFDAAAIQAVQPGDVIVTDGEEIKIETVDTDGPDFVFNKCTENEMLFCDAGHDEFEHCMDNDYVPWIKLTTLELEQLEYYPIIDNVDPISGDILEDPVIYRGDRLMELLKNPDAVSFSVKNVDVVYDRNNMPVLMIRYYSPAQ